MIIINKSMQFSLVYSNWAFFPIAFIYIVIIFFTIFGNVLVFVALFRFKRLRSTSNFLIGNLALSDLLLAITVLPFSATTDLTGIWLFGPILCDIWLTIDVFYCTASVWSLVAIAFDRFTATTFPIWYRSNQTKKRIIFYMIIVWILSGLICLPGLLGWGSQNLNEFNNLNNTHNNINLTIPIYKLNNDENRNLTNLNKFPYKSSTNTHVFNENINNYECVLFTEPEYIVYSAMGSFILPLIIMTGLYMKIFIVLQKRANILEENNKLKQIKFINNYNNSTTTTTNNNNNDKFIEKSDTNIKFEKQKLKSNIQSLSCTNLCYPISCKCNLITIHYPNIKYKCNNCSHINKIILSSQQSSFSSSSPLSSPSSSSSTTIPTSTPFSTSSSAKTIKLKKLSKQLKLFYCSDKLNCIHSNLCNKFIFKSNTILHNIDDNNLNNTKSQQHQQQQLQPNQLQNDLISTELNDSNYSSQEIFNIKELSLNRNIHFPSSPNICVDSDNDEMNCAINNSKNNNNHDFIKQNYSHSHTHSHHHPLHHHHHHRHYHAHHLHQSHLHHIHRKHKLQSALSNQFDELNYPTENKYSTEILTKKSLSNTIVNKIKNLFTSNYSEKKSKTFYSQINTTDVNNSSISSVVHPSDDNKQQTEFESIHSRKNNTKQIKTENTCLLKNILNKRKNIFSNNKNLKNNEKNKMSRENQDQFHERVDRRERRATKRMALIIIIFVLCWIPFTLMYLVRGLCGEKNCPDILDLRIFVTWLGYINSTINPILYALFNKQFRQAFLILINCKHCHLKFFNSSSKFNINNNNNTTNNNNQTKWHNKSTNSNFSK